MRKAAGIRKLGGRVVDFEEHEFHNHAFGLTWRCISWFLKKKGWVTNAHY